MIIKNNNKMETNVIRKKTRKFPIVKKYKYLGVVLDNDMSLRPNTI